MAFSACQTQQGDHGTMHHLLYRMLDTPVHHRLLPTYLNSCYRSCCHLFPATGALPTLAAAAGSSLHKLKPGLPNRHPRRCLEEPSTAWQAPKKVYLLTLLYGPCCTWHRCCLQQCGACTILSIFGADTTHCIMQCWYPVCTALELGKKFAAAEPCMPRTINTVTLMHIMVLVCRLGSGPTHQRLQRR
jgi:hypothetical protein